MQCLFYERFIVVQSCQLFSLLSRIIVAELLLLAFALALYQDRRAIDPLLQAVQQVNALPPKEPL